MIKIINPAMGKKNAVTIDIATDGEISFHKKIKL